jgi:Rieske Fe-S protein
VAPSGDPINESRRRFCRRSCRTVFTAAVIPLWDRSVASSDQEAGTDSAVLPVVRGTVQDEVVRVPVASTPLDAVGGAVRVVSNAGAFLVTRTSETEVLVVTAICSHDACGITDVQGPDYICGCHGSRFDRAGVVKAGPAELPLTQYVAEITDGILAIRF